MSSTELFALLDRAQSGDDEACRQVLTENAGLIWSIVRRYSGCGVETDDLYQLGCIGFIKAVKGFDLHYGTQFSTYAVPKIAGEIRRFLRDDGAVKVGRTIRERGQTLWSVRERLRGRLGREPKLSELSAETGWTPEEIASIDLATVAPESLQQETAEGLTLESTLGSESPEGELIEKIALREAIDSLPEREQKTILLRFFKGLTQEQTARILGVSQVQRIAQKADQLLILLHGNGFSVDSERGHRLVSFSHKKRSGSRGIISHISKYYTISHHRAQVRLTRRVMLSKK